MSAREEVGTDVRASREAGAEAAPTRAGSEAMEREILDERERLLAHAYRMLGSVADAEDVVQEAYAALHRAQVRPDTPRAWLTTVVTRLCLDRAKSAAARREVYVGPWLPEPLPTAGLPAAEAPDERISTAESVSLAFLLVLERLSPLERAVFLLREVMDLGFDEIARTLGRSEAACRQLLHRAKRHVASARPRFRPAEAEHRRLVEAFFEAAGGGDLAAIERLLTEDVTLITDGGGKTTAARRVLEGRDRVGRFALGVFPRGGWHGRTWCWVNGELGAVFRDGDGRLRAVAAFSLGPDGDQIARILAVLNPDKLRSFERLLPAALPLARA